MGWVLCISSQTVYGPVGNSAAVPALQEMGHEVMALPTVVLSNHPGHGPTIGQPIPAALLNNMLAVLANLGALNRVDAVLTGYFASAAQVVVAAEKITDLAKLNQDLHVLVDPVIGDHGKLYVAEEVAVAIRDHLLPLATITTPNLFELQWLSSSHVIAGSVRTLNVDETIVTSVPLEPEQLDTQLHVGGSVTMRAIARRNKVPHGTGDFLAGAYLARRMLMPAPLAFNGAMERLELAIGKSVGSATLMLH